MHKWIFDHDKNLTQETRSKLYVALTRARYSAGIVCKTKKSFNSDIVGVKRYERCIKLDRYSFL